ncbi:MAG TPA: hypothetical protein VHS74_09800 [Solirubrobacterales bacterium]|nr:hypothetical protein [Solirubrobacterales bacterium]
MTRRSLNGLAILIGLLACLAPPSALAALPDGRGWELVSPLEKNGGAVASPGTIAGGGVLQAAADGNSVTYGSATSFEAVAQGAPTASQYLSTRGAEGWSTQNLTVPIFSGSYGAGPDGVPYQLFSPDLGRGLLLSGRHCRSVGTDCPVANPPLAGTDAPAGYQNYYLRQASGFEALVGTGDVAATALQPAQFELRFAGASPDLGHVILESCAALTPTATETVLGEGCDPGKPNLYEWSVGSGLTLVNSLPGAELAAQGAAVSADGGRVYWKNLEDGNLYLREGAQTKQVDGAVGGGGTFETASANGAVAFFTKAGTLYRYDAQSATSAPLAAEVTGVLGVSEDGSYLYYLATTGLYLWHGGGSTLIAAPPIGDPSPAAMSSDYPPSTGTARVTPDGTNLAFLSQARLTGYNNSDLKTGLPDPEVYLYEAGGGQLRCVSCRPNGTRPTGPSSIPSSNPNGEGGEATDSYKPRALSVDGSRVFFDSSDALGSGDSNQEPDVYQWERPGTNCAKAAGCIDLISSGRSEGGAVFVDASLSGADVFFVTDGSLVGTDPGSFDLYDARVGGGFPEPPPPISCFSDACQSLPSEPTDPALGTLVSGLGNPKVHYKKYRHHVRRHKGKKQHRKNHHGHGKDHHKKHNKSGKR